MQPFFRHLLDHLRRVRREYKLCQIEQVLMVEEIERVKAQGEAIGIAKRDMEIALKKFRKAKPGADLDGIVENLRDIDIPEEIIEASRKQAESERA
ncbi:MAG: hypothetical protein LBU32_07145 [Clostridiales bacterium]|nr:hypothetical protein [Clostridiales bacterium]